MIRPNVTDNRRCTGLVRDGNNLAECVKIGVTEDLLRLKARTDKET